ncbi:ankyrin repeat domain-containing protein 2 [Diplogelasinospora grovesii]|uniref:Ankyrin repeat domain-containing protein 2 n=1 Tax=Diplogelasinospora grovesii TaxID=303347 RepID=A0AAN6S049_9PEZI|nr:ankyrin repeat domain-containing protein 2 [Diplogelasinospora grovesii]
MEPASSSTSLAKCTRRGRREKPWPPSKQKKLLRLYVCTQSEHLPLMKILERLKDDPFNPKQRNSHKLLNSLLPDRRIDDWRPRDLQSMHMRMRFLRSVRAERRMRRRARHRPASAQPYGVDSFMVAGPHLRTYQNEPIFSPQECQETKTTLSVEHEPDSWRDTTALIRLPGSSAESSPPTAGACSTATPETCPRPISPCRSTSNKSTKSASKRRSWASVLSSISSGISSLARSSSSASSKPVNLKDPLSNNALSNLTREQFLALLEEDDGTSGGARKGGKSADIFRRRYSSTQPTTEELNTALVKMCCSALILEDGGLRSPGCVHGRLSRAIDAQRAEGPAFQEFYVTDAEANAVDKYGNSLLYVAARWGARVSILLNILRHTDDMMMVNHRGETFLHVYDPPAHPHLRPASFVNLMRSLRSRGFDFCQRDVEKQTFLHRLAAKKEFPVETLYSVFREVGYASARFLVANKTASGQRLWHCVCKNLQQHNPKLHRIFGDEKEFIRRYLPEFSERDGVDNSHSRDGSTAMSTTDRPSWLVPRHAGSGSPIPHDDEHGGSRGAGLKRTPLMELLHKTGSSGGDHGEDKKTLEASMAELLGLGGKKKPAYFEQMINARDTKGNTALHYAAEFGLSTAVHFLCKNEVSVNVFNNCGNTPLQLIKYAIQRTDVRNDIHMEARYLRCAVVLLDNRAIDQSKLVSERSVIFSNGEGIFDGSEQCIVNLVRQGVANQCRGLHLLGSSLRHHSPLHCGGEGSGGSSGGGSPLPALSFHTSLY